MVKSKKTAEDWARQWCAVIENRGAMALSPPPIFPEDKLPNKSNIKKLRSIEPIIDVETNENNELSMAKLESEITGTRVIMPEDRDHLEREVKLLRPAFDALSNYLRANVDRPVDLESLFRTLGELLSAAYYVGAYTTVSLGAQEFVTPAVLRNRVKIPQRAKVIKDRKNRQRLRAAIMKAAGGRELKGSKGFGEQIHPKVAALLGSKKDEWPSPKKIKDEIQVMNRERRLENKGPPLASGPHRIVE